MVHLRDSQSSSLVSNAWGRRASGRPPTPSYTRGTKRRWFYKLTMSSGADLSDQLFRTVTDTPSGRQELVQLPGEHRGVRAPAESQESPTTFNALAPPHSAPHEAEMLETSLRTLTPHTGRAASARRTPTDGNRHEE
ncbi:unnamed protein product [Pleuronectes platessa]|uniref:Uncharacterized protein n=1 Tax=Pleuronectes platessa TaxID=8262 RepID=A0A9N7ZEM0_PLEPL|nr:unnamed protein product [Pleuronectes platessa]